MENVSQLAYWHFNAGNNEDDSAIESMVTFANNVIQISQKMNYFSNGDCHLTED